MEDSVSGFRITGSWDDVVEHGERITAAVRRVVKRKEEVEGREMESVVQEIDDFGDWRPKVDDKEDTMSNRTAEKASVGEGTLEKENKTVQETAAEAQADMKEAVDSATKLDTEETQEKLNESVVRTGQMTDSFFRRVLRWFEERVYKHVMTQISPYYFDNQLINANFTEHSKKKYTLEISIADDEIRDCVREEMAVIEEEAPNWRVESRINTEPAVESEGIDAVPETSTKDIVESEVDSSDNERVLHAADNDD